MGQLVQLASKAKALQARLVKSGGAYHTKLMASAQEEVSKLLDEMRPKMQPPRCSVYFNMIGKRVPAGADPDSFMVFMKEHIVNEALWEPTIKAMIMDNVKDFVEVGPLKQLKSMLKRIDADAFKRAESISV